MGRLHPEKLQQCYEGLRNHALNPTSSVDGYHGLAILVGRGVAAWIQAELTEIEGSGTATTRDVSTLPAVSGGNHEWVVVFASLVQGRSISQAVCHD